LILYAIAKIRRRIVWRVKSLVKLNNNDKDQS
jgi:hypothetical protein